MTLTEELIILNLAVLGAAALQAAAGLGFGVVAGPVLLLQLNSADAVPVSILLNLVIAGLLTPSLWPHQAPRLLGRFVVGSLLGLPFGVWLLISVDFTTLKLLAGIAVLLAAVSVIWKKSAAETGEGPSGDTGALPLLAGGAAGLMGGSLAMPGPVPAAWMAANGYGKQAVRATILALFLAAYTGALVLHGAVNGLSSAILCQTAVLVPATVIGVFVGGRLAGRLSEGFFRSLILAVLVVSSGSLFWSVL